MNNLQFNNQFNGGNPALTSSIASDFSFDGYNLNSICSDCTPDPLDPCKCSSGTIIQKMNGMDLDNISLVTFESSIEDGGGVIDKRYGNKTVSMELFIQGCESLGYTDLVERIWELKKRTRWIEKPLVLTVWGYKRTYTATVSSITIPQHSIRQDFLDGIQIDFLITSPFWSWDAVSTLQENVTGNTEKVIENVGDHNSFPIITLIAWVGTNLSGITIGNRYIEDTSTFNVSVSTSVVAGDILVFDYVEKTIKKNWVELNISWVFTPMDTGYNVFELFFTGTANMSIYYTYNPLYL